MSSLSLATPRRKAFVAAHMQPSSALRDGVIAGISAALNRELTARGMGSLSTRRALWQLLEQRLIQVRDLADGRRHVSVCEDRSVFKVSICPDTLPPLQDLYPNGRATGLCARPNDPQPSPQFWQGLSPSQWRSTLQDWLMGVLARWMRPTDEPVDAACLITASELAHAGVADVYAYYPALQWLLMDALGYPRELVRYAYRNHQRNPPAANPDGQRQLVRHWPAWADWYGRALKLFPLALALADRDAPPPDLVTTRDMLMQHGLSRNAWALLYRLPSPIVSLIADDVRLFSLDHQRTRYLQHLSLWCARLGRETLCRRPSQYRACPTGMAIYRQGTLHPLACRRENVLRLMLALVWPVKELTLMTRPDPAHFQPPGRVDHGLTFRLPGMTGLTLLRHRQELIDPQGRLQEMLLSFSRHLLQPGSSVDASFSALQDMLDWFRLEGVALPVTVFKHPFPVLRGLSVRWHNAHREHRMVPAEDPRLYATWTVSLPLFEHEGGQFRALLTSAELEAEGHLMQHCVAGYAKDCATHRCRIYAVSFREQRVGTLEVRHFEGQWRVTQFKGLKNHNLMTALTHPDSLLHIPFQHFLAALTASS